MKSLRSRTSTMKKSARRRPSCSKRATSWAHSFPSSRQLNHSKSNLLYSSKSKSYRELAYLSRNRAQAINPLPIKVPIWAHTTRPLSPASRSLSIRMRILTIWTWRIQWGWLEAWRKSNMLSSPNPRSIPYRAYPRRRSQMAQLHSRLPQAKCTKWRSSLTIRPNKMP